MQLFLQNKHTFLLVLVQQKLAIERSGAAPANTNVQIHTAISQKI